MSKTSSVDSVSKLLDLYMSKANLSFGSNHFLICPLRYDSVKKQNIVINKSISYSICREIIKESVDRLGLDASLYSTHSARAGGATDLAPHSTQLELQVSGRWNDPRSISHYVEIPLERRLSLSRVLSMDQ